MFYIVKNNMFRDVLTDPSANSYSLKSPSACILYSYTIRQ